MPPIHKDVYESLYKIQIEIITYQQPLQSSIAQTSYTNINYAQFTLDNIGNIATRLWSLANIP